MAKAVHKTMHHPKMISPHHLLLPFNKHINRLTNTGKKNSCASLLPHVQHRHTNNRINKGMFDLLLLKSGFHLQYSRPLKQF